ncbi:putative ribonuclease H-like domain-containing protein [Tanacetum coccineum]
MVPKAVLMRSGLVSLATARPVNTPQPRTTVNGARLMTNVNTARPKVVLNAVKGNHVNAIKASACWVWKLKTKIQVSNGLGPQKRLVFLPYVQGNPQQDLQKKGVIDSGCSRHMTENMSYLTDFEEINEGYVAFGELKFNLFSVSQMCDKKNSVLFNDTECIVLSPNFKLTDESHVLLKVPRKNNMYSVDLKNIVPKGGLTCLFAKSKSDESKLWHRRLGHINFKTINKLVKENLVRGLPLKLFENNQTCVACQKGKQHRASCKSKTVSSISQPLHMLHMDLFGPTFVKSLMKKMYCLVVTDDYSRFSWVFFLATKDETSGILKSFITGVKNLIDQKVKVIRCDNGTEFQNKEMNQFCKRKGIKREFSVARTPQQNGIAERKNRTLIEAARTMLADSKLPTTFWAKAFNTACYVQNRVLVTKPHNKIPYELFLGSKPALGFMRPFRCHVTILNTIDHLGKFDGKAVEGFFVGYSIKSTKACDDTGKARMETMPGKDYILLPLWPADPPYSQDPKSSQDDGSKPLSDDGKKIDKDPRKYSEGIDQEKEDNVNSTNNVNDASTNEVNVIGEKTSIELPLDLNMPELEDYSIFEDDEDVGVEANMNHLDTTIQVSPIPTTRIHKDRRTQKGNSCIEGSKLDRGYVGRASTIQDTRSLDFEGRIDYDEVFAPVARIKAIRPFLAYASFKDFMVYQMDVKSAFLYGNIEEEVYVCQPPGFEDPYFPDRVYKVEKALHRALKAWYKGDILLLQVYVDDIIFGSTNKELCNAFEKFTEVKTASTPIETQKPLLKDEDGEEVDVHMYRSMIGSLMYLTSSRPDIMFVVCACTRYQVNPKVSHLHAVKRIFRYLKGQPKLGLWYPKDSPFNLVAYTDSDYAGASLDRKSTTRGCQFLGCRLISWQCKKQTMVANSTTEAEYVAASSCCRQVLWIQNQLLDYGYNFMHTKIFIDNNSTICIIKNPVFHSKTKHIEIRHHFIRDCNDKKLIQMVKIHTDKNVADLLTKAFDVTVWNGIGVNTGDSKLMLLGINLLLLLKVNAARHKLTTAGENEAVCKELDNSLVRAATTAPSLEAEQDSGTIIKTRSKAIPNEAGFPETSLGGGPRCQETMGDTIAQIRFENVSKTSNDSLLAGVNIPRSDEDSMKLMELMDFCTKLQQRVLDLENTKTAQAQEITSLKLRVKKLEKKGGSRTHKLKRIYKVGRSARIVSSDEASLGNEEDASKHRRKINDIDKDVFLMMKKCLHDIPDEEVVAIDVIPLATKPPTIVDWKIHKEGKNKYYQIIRVDGSSKMYRVFSLMLKSFDRQDLKDLYKLVKDKYGSTRPVEDLDLILYRDLKTMFDPHVEDQAKTVNEEVQLQALVDRKKVIITESTVRRDLHLEDAKGVDCLPIATIFEQLTLMGYEKLLQKLTFFKAFFSLQRKFLIHTILQCLSVKTTPWNEFSSTMASVIILCCTNQKFNFLKDIFEYGEGTWRMCLKQKPRKPKRKDTEVPQPSGPTNNVADKAVYKEMDDSLERAVTTATSLDAE